MRVFGLGTTTLGVLLIMKIILLSLFFSISLVAADSTATVIVNGTTIEFQITDEFYINLIDFQNFLDTKIHNSKFNEMIAEDLTGDKKIDTLYNQIYLTDDGCIIKSKIISNKSVVYSDSAEIYSDEGNNENIWGSDSVYNLLYPYSLLYIAYRSRPQSYTLEKEYIDNDIFMYLNFKRDEFEKMRLNKNVIESKLNEVKQYVNNYKGKFINSISLSDPDTYIYESASNKFVIFYSP